MNITNFQNFRIETEHSGDGVFADVRPFDSGSSSGFMVTAYNIPSFKNSWAKHKVEVRRKENQTALIVYKYNDSEIDEWWNDAEVLYSWTQPAMGDK
ncbi:hypothetical protein [Paenibacillus sp. FSL R7-0128]|uniref:hypothetical protein n=1 Tax=Paenibacillus sp. FSL R7-0128 TaxID=2954529 RepID=UPI0030FC839E